MPWRDDFVEAVWLDPDFGLSGYPEQKDAPKEPRNSFWERDLIPDEEMPPPVALDILAKEESQQREPVEAALSLRDRIGFRYERIVGLDDFVSQREAAQLLGIPKMKVNRWVRGKRIPTMKKNGYSVIRLRDVLQAAKDQNLPLKVVGRIRT